MIDSCSEVKHQIISVSKHYGNNSSGYKLHAFGLFVQCTTKVVTNS